MEIDFDARDAISDFISVPAGTYVCRITEVRTGTTRAGDERWSIRLVVDEGMHVGKQAAWDSLVFSVRGRTRARLLLYAFACHPRARCSYSPKISMDGVQWSRSDRPSMRPHRAKSYGATKSRMTATGSQRNGFQPIGSAQIRTKAAKSLRMIQRPIRAMYPSSEPTVRTDSGPARTAVSACH